MFGYGVIAPRSGAKRSVVMGLCSSLALAHQAVSSTKLIVLQYLLPPRPTTSTGASFLPSHRWSCRVLSRGSSSARLRSYLEANHELLAALLPPDTSCDDLFSEVEVAANERNR